MGCVVFHGRVVQSFLEGLDEVWELVCGDWSEDEEGGFGG
jgi:hypothetical protein